MAFWGWVGGSSALHFQPSWLKLQSRQVRETCRQIFSELHSQDRICAKLRKSPGIQPITKLAMKHAAIWKAHEHAVVSYTQQWLRKALPQSGVSSLFAQTPIRRIRPYCSAVVVLCLTCIDRLFILAGAAILGLSPPSQILSSSTDDSGLLAASCLPRLGHLLRKSQRGFAPDSQRSSAGHSKGSGCRP